MIAILLIYICTATVIPSILIPYGRVLLVTKAKGTVDYTCLKSKFVATSSTAILYQNQTMIGQHTYQIQGIDAGYHIFTHTDGSKLKTKPIDFVTRKGTLGWTKMGKILGLHSGVFQDVGHVVRLNTKDGIVNGPCVADTSVSYECEYWFYVS